MGLKGLWQLLSPTKSPISIEELNGLVLAIDINIWVYQMIRLQSRNQLSKSSIEVALEIFFHRLCKLLFANICPVMVYEGKAPVIKKRALNTRATKDRLITEKSRRILKDLIIERLLSSDIHVSDMDSSNCYEFAQDKSQAGYKHSLKTSPDCTESHTRKSLSCVVPFSDHYEQLSSAEKLLVIESHRKLNTSFTNNIAIPSHDLLEHYNLSNDSSRAFSISQLKKINYYGLLVKESCLLKDALRKKKVLKTSLSASNPFNSETTLSPKLDQNLTVHDSEDSYRYLSFEDIKFHTISKQDAFFLGKSHSTGISTQEKHILEKEFQIIDPSPLEPTRTSDSNHDKQLCVKGSLTPQPFDFIFLPNSSSNNSMIENLVDHIPMPHNQILAESDVKFTPGLISAGNEAMIPRPLSSEFAQEIDFEKITSKKVPQEGSSNIYLDTVSKDNYEQFSHIFNKLKTQSIKSSKPSTILLSLLKELAALFGCINVDSAQEAEAQCSWLAINGLVDGIISDDSDTILFCELMNGSSVCNKESIFIIRNFFKKKNSISEGYKIQDIRNKLGFDDSIYAILIQLLPSDYGDGIAGVGPITALEIVAFLKENKMNLKQFIQLASGSKMNSLNHILGDSVIGMTKRIKSVMKLLSHKTISNIPEIKIEEAYKNPQVFKDLLEKKPAPAMMKIEIDKICSFMKLNLNWPKEKTMGYLTPVLLNRERLKEKQRTRSIKSYFKLTKSGLSSVSPASRRVFNSIEVILKSSASNSK